MASLEVDETLLSQDIKFQDTEDEKRENLFPKPNVSGPLSKMVLPTAGFCIKTVTTGTEKKKAFINLCHTDEIASPDDITEMELREIWSSEDNSRYQVPMSVAAPRVELDKHGVPCDVYEIAIGTIFFKKIKSNLYFRIFLFQVIFEGLDFKLGVKLEIPGAKVLKNRKAMGTIMPHRIEIRKLVETVDGSQAPQYILELVGRELVGRFHLPKIAAQNIKVQVGEDRIRVEAPPKYLADVFIPFSVEHTKVATLFNCQTDTLTVTVPVSSSNTNTA